jgi:hypothetical protein
MLSFEKGAYIHLWAVNDSPETVRGVVRIQLFHPQRNEVRREIVRDVRVAPGKSEVIVRLDEAGIGTFRREHVLYASLTNEAGQRVAECFSYGDIERRMQFPDAQLTVRVSDGQLIISSDKFARAVTLQGDADGDESGWLFADNYFDMMPGETRAVRILGDHTTGQVSAKAWYSPHTTMVQWRK